jgi:hypothetical protein
MANRVERSIDNLQRLYTIVVGLALTEAVTRYVLGPVSGVASRLPTSLYNPEYLPAMIAFLVTLVPFYHGAIRYLDETYVTGRGTPKTFALLIDFWVLFIEALIFFWMALAINNWRVFFGVFMLLLVLDIAWIAVVYFYSETFTDIWHWGVINFATFIVTGVVLKTPLLDDADKLPGLAVVAVLRSFLDYLWNWRFFHPGPEAPTV